MPSSASWKQLRPFLELRWKSHVPSPRLTCWHYTWFAFADQMHKQDSKLACWAETAHWLMMADEVTNTKPHKICSHTTVFKMKNIFFLTLCPTPFLCRDKLVNEVTHSDKITQLCLRPPTSASQKNPWTLLTSSWSPWSCTWCQTKASSATPMV